MYKRLIITATLLLSAKIYALSCSVPITISDLRFDASYAHVFANEKGDAAVIWLSNQAKDNAVTVSYKAQNSSWSSPEIISEWEKSIYKNRCFVNADGDLFATWKVEKGNSFLVQIAEKKQRDPWSLPLDWISSNSNFYYPKVKFDSFGKFTCIAEIATKRTTKPAYPGGYTYETTIPGIAILTKSPGETEQNWDSFTIEDGSFYSISGLSIAMNKNGMAYAFWANNKYPDVLMGRKIQNGRFILESEVICHLQSYSYDLKASFNEKGDAAVAYCDARSNGKIITKFEDVWSEPFLFTSQEEKHLDIQISIDDAGNVMAACAVGVDGHFLVKATYKPFGESWMAPVLFSHPNAENWFPKIKPDGNGNFVMIWQQQIGHRNAIFGATFSTAIQTWCDPQHLSPEGESCFGCSFVFWAPGKGYISWTTCPNRLDENVQVAELLN